MKKAAYLLFAWFLSQSYFANSQTCTYLAYDPFPGTPNTALNNSSGGTGWSSPWFVQNNLNTIPGYQFSGSSSLAYLDLQNSGIYSSGGLNYTTAGRDFDVSSAGPFSAQLNGDGNIGADGANLWFSALLAKNQNTDESLHIGWHASGLSWCEGCTTEKIAFGYFGANSNSGGQRFWTLRIGNSTYIPTAIPVVAGAPVFVALNFSFGSNSDTLRLYVNPTTLGDQVPATPTLTQILPFNLEIRHFYAYLGYAPGIGSLDEIRVANSYRCVAPDADVVVNQPPNAAFSALPASGQRPLFVQFDGTASSDPETGIEVFEWDFADGSPTVFGATTSHIFTSLGPHNVSLTVTDSTGLTHQTYQIVTVFDENGSFPCLSSFTLQQQATCGQSNGRIVVHANSGTFQLLNNQNNPMPLTNGNQFQNLPAGQYVFTHVGTNGCRDTALLFVPVDSSTCAGWQPADCALGIGMNLTGVADWTNERPFTNLFKQVREETITFSDTCYCWNTNVSSQLRTDANGYPIYLPQMTTAGPTRIRWVMSSNGGALEADSDYLLLYDGEGDIQLQGDLSSVNAAPGRIAFHTNGTGNIWMNLNTSISGNRVRNIRMLRPEDEFTNLNTNQFYSGFLDKIRPFKALRMMDWGATNGSPQIAWADRSKRNWRTWGTNQGVPYEVMIALANELDKDIWVCVPHQADDDFIQNMATLFKNQLEPERKIYLEYSNEVWNWLFSQAHYNAATTPDHINYGRAYAEKSKHTFDIWYQVFGTSAPERLERVLGMQLGYNYLNEQILSHLDSEDWDAASPTFYFGLDSSPNGNPVLDASSTPDDVMTNAENAWNSFLPAWRADYNQAKLFGKKIIGYEGGQHFTQFQVTPFQQAMYQAYQHPRMYQLYNRVIDSARVFGMELAMAFSNVGSQTDIYVFGHLPDVEVLPPYYGTAIRYATLLDNIKDCYTGACKKPVGTKTIFLSPTSVLLRWDDTGGSSYQIQLRLPGVPVQNITVASNQYVVTGLTPGTTVSWRVRAQCANWSGYSPYQFLYVPVSGGCTRPIQLVTNLITPNSAQLAWEPQPDVIRYQIQYRPLGTSTWTSFFSVQPRLSISGLSPSTAYEWRLRAQCSSGYTPYNSDLANFSTLAIPVPLYTSDQEYISSNKTNLSILPNPNFGKFSLQIFSESAGEVKITIRDNMGRVVLSKNVTAAAGDNLSPIDLDSYSSGQYFVSVVLPSGIVRTERVLILDKK